MTKLAYGNTLLTLPIDAQVLLSPPLSAIGPSVEDAVQIAVQACMEAHRITLVVPDPTRPAVHTRVLPILMPYLAVKEVTIIIATGAHSAPNEEYLAELQRMAPQAKVVVHDCDRSPLTRLGTTRKGTPVDVNSLVLEADFALGIGSVAIHPFAGFSGGPKVFVPGCASRATITANHSLLVQQEAGPAVLQGNPIYDDLMDATEFIKGAFIINEALSPEGKPLGYFAGSIEVAHKGAAQLALQAASAEIDEPYDLVIASCGGYPRDINLYQAVKALDMASLACAKGGKLILLAECREGVGSPLYEEWAAKSFAQQEDMVKTSFMVGAHKSYLAGRILKKLQQAVLVSALPRETVSTMGFTPAATLEEALELTNANECTRIAAVPFGTTTLPIVIVKDREREER
ncbi:MAG: nickel-dependent lactate racemase [Bacillota bacterium]|nr:nickel-dependent lactate racemase [Bacillota bacterium]